MVKHDSLDDRPLWNKNISLIDVAADLTAPCYQGVYEGESFHPPDLQNVLSRAWFNRIKRIIIKGSSLEQSQKAVDLANTDERLYSTVGCSPKNCKNFDQDGREKYFMDLRDICLKNRDKVVAIGECGLDYTNLSACDRVTQIRYFRLQIELARLLELPMLIICRDAGEDMARILKNYYDDIPRAVIHSFNGTADDGRRILAMGYYIGLSGCSIKTKENREVIEELPVQGLVLGSDAPTCEILPGQHVNAQYLKTMYYREKKHKWAPDRLVKSRNEPCSIVQVLEVTAAVKNENPDALAAISYDNSKNVFFPQSRKNLHL